MVPPKAESEQLAAAKIHAGDFGVAEKHIIESCLIDV